LPLLVEGAPTGVLTFHFTVPVNFDDEYQTLLVSVAHHCAQALDRARLYESTQRARADAERANRIKDEFVSIVSHELRTPLTPLTLQIDRLRRRLMAGRESPDDLSAIQVSLQRQTDRLTGLVDILLDITRLRTGRMTLDREAVDLAALARETVEGLGEEMARANCTVTVEAPYVVRGSWDRTRLVQALTNLLSNAAKYAAGAPVSVSVSGQAAEARLVGPASR
jgi:signal transduction histidine kinase